MGTVFLEHPEQFADILVSWRVSSEIVSRVFNLDGGVGVLINPGTFMEFPEASKFC